MASDSLAESDTKADQAFHFTMQMQTTQTPPYYGASGNHWSTETKVRKRKYESEKKSHLSVSSVLLTHDCALEAKGDFSKRCESQSLTHCTSVSTNTVVQDDMVSVVLLWSHSEFTVTICECFWSGFVAGWATGFQHSHPHHCQDNPEGIICTVLLTSQSLCTGWYAAISLASHTLHRVWLARQVPRLSPAPEPGERG